MKQFKDKVIIGIDHGYGNIKTANHVFKTGVLNSDDEPLFTKNLLVYDGRYYTIGEGHKEFTPEKQIDEDYYVLTLAAIAMELHSVGKTDADVFIAAGLPLTWTNGQKSEFSAYLTKNNDVTFTFQRVRYEKELKVRKSNLQNVRIEYAKEQEKLSDLRAEVVRSIQGESVYSKEMLAGLVKEVDANVRKLETVLKEAEREVEEKESLIKELCDCCDEIMSWSELYDSASLEAKKMIVNAMITRIDVYHGYELNVEFNFNIRQFFEGIAEKEEAPAIETSAALPKTA